MVITSSFRLSGFHLRDLLHHVCQIQEFALSAATKRHYNSIWNTYLKFCHFYNLQPFPASPSTIAAFIISVSFSVKSHHTINNYLSALRRLHVFCRQIDSERLREVHDLHSSLQSSSHTIHLAPIQSPSKPARLRSFGFVVCLSGWFIYILLHSKSVSLFTQKFPSPTCAVSRREGCGGG